jgi:hypothetical protein
MRSWNSSALIWRKARGGSTELRLAASQVFQSRALRTEILQQELTFAIVERRAATETEQLNVKCIRSRDTHDLVFCLTVGAPEFGRAV